MAPWTSYKLVEGGEGEGGDVDLDGDDGAVRVVTKPGWLEEWLQPLNALLRKFDETSRPLRKRMQPLTDRLEPLTDWLCTATGTAICAAILITILIASVSVIALASPKEDVLQYVDPLIGTGPGGHVFAGATLPFGMAKPVADVTAERMGGFASDRSPISGFSHLHDSGTGGSPSMGNYPLFVYPDCLDDNVDNCEFSKYARATGYITKSVNATPGYFTIDLVSGVRAEMTASERTALYRFSFLPSNSNDTKQLQPVISADASDLPPSNGKRNMYINATTGRMTGEGRFNPSFGDGSYKVYFCADFKGAELRDIGGFNGSGTFPNATSMIGKEAFDGPDQGVYARFKNVDINTKILARVGLSWLSIDRACKNAQDEISDWNFKRVRRAAADAWRKKFEPIQLSAPGVDKQHLRNFWSGVYRAFISPQDYTGENPLWNSSEPYYDSWYCIWDTFRGVHPFFTLVDPISQSRMVRSLIDIYKHEGWLPDCRMSFCKGFTQGGSNADVILVDGFIKKLPGVDWDEAYKAIVKDAEVEPPNWDIEGRGGLKSWKQVGYIPYLDDDMGGLRTRSVSRTVEYAYNDFCIAQMANATGKRKDYKKYSKRASNWKNVFKKDHESMGFTGFPQPRWKNGTWSFQNATLCSSLNNFDGCYLNPGGHETYEGSPWLYTFYVPGDMAGLVKMLGGRKAFIKRLDKLHDSGVLYMGDEQAFLTAFLYHYAGRPGLSVKRTHSYIPREFNDTIGGIPGNDDSGAMGTFVFFSMLGIFPNAGQSVYYIIPPFFKSVRIRNPQTGKVATIRNTNFDPKYRKIYIQSATLNGKPYTKNWVDHKFFANGGTLDLVLGDKESDWGTGKDDVPPSLSTGLYF